MKEPNSTRRKVLIALVAFLGCLIIAIPTALFFGLGDLLFGKDASSAVFTVIFMAVGLALLWTLQFAWESRRNRPRDGKH